MSLFGREKSRLVDASQALPGRPDPIPGIPTMHAVFPDRRILPPFPEGMATAVFGMGCFWGAERLFWQTPGVYSTAVGYAAGYTPNPTYEEVCSGLTGHAEVVLAVYDPTVISYPGVLKVFWEGHDPTQGMRQGNDVGSQYRSLILLTDPTQRPEAEATRDSYQAALSRSGLGTITTAIADPAPLYYAEDYHQQYLHKVPNGYCGLGGTGISCPVGLVSGEDDERHPIG